MRLTNVLILALLMVATVFAQDKLNWKPMSSPGGLEGKVKFQYAVENLDDQTTVYVRTEMLDREYHVYSVIDAEGIAYRPTSIELLGTDPADGGAYLGATSEDQKPHSYEDEIMMGTINEHKQRVVVFSRALKSIAIPAKTTHFANFNIQVCNNGMCRMVQLPISY